MCHQDGIAVTSQGQPTLLSGDGCRQLPSSGQGSTTGCSHVATLTLMKASSAPIAQPVEKVDAAWT